MPNYIIHNSNYKKGEFMKNIIITIGREYGSGGKYIAEQVAKKLNIQFYDKELINETSEKNGVDYSKLEEYDEVSKNSIIKVLNLVNTGNTEEAFSDNIYQTLISNTIKQISEKGSCVILGRNSNQILKDKDNVINIFIYSNNLEFKIQRKMQIENLTHEEAFSKLKNVDKNRRKYYESLNKNCIWGDKKGYDYLIDSSILGVDGTVDLIVNLYHQYQDK